MMNIVIVGQGAIGLLWYSQLIKVSANVSLLCSARQHMTPTDMGYTNPSGEQESLALNIVPKEQLTDADVIIFCLKAYDIEPALEQYQAFIAKQCQVIFCHNGMVCTNILTRYLPHNPLFALLTTHGSKKDGDFNIIHTGLGKSDIGAISHKVQNEPSQMVNLFDSALPQVFFQEQIEVLQWTKLAINCVINPLTALNNIDNGEVLQAKFSATVEALINEVVLIASKENIVLSASELNKIVRDVAKKTANNCSSMRSDIMNQRKTEIDYINGYIHRLGEQYHLSTPQNTKLWRAIATLEQG